MKRASKSKPSPSSFKQQKLSMPNPVPVLTCPVCSRVLWSDASFSYMHIDQCLQKQPSQDRHSDTKAMPSIASSSNKPGMPASAVEVVDIDAIDCAAPMADAALSPMKKQRCDMEVTTSACAIPFSRQPLPSSSAGIHSLILPTLRLEPIAPLPGLYLIPNFITIAEEAALLAALDSVGGVPWQFSAFTGHCDTKVYGARTSYQDRLVRANHIDKGEADMPACLQMLLDRLQVFVRSQPPSAALPLELHSFRSNGCNVNSYCKSKGAFLKPHYDDRALSGPLIVNLSMLGDCYMTYWKPNPNPLDTAQPFVDTQRVLLSRRCLQIMTQAARWSYMHSISSEDFLSERRVSVTFRQAGGKAGVVKTASKGSQDLMRGFLEKSSA